MSINPASTHIPRVVLISGSTGRQWCALLIRVVVRLLLPLQPRDGRLTAHFFIFRGHDGFVTSSSVSLLSAMYATLACA